MPQANQSPAERVRQIMARGEYDHAGLWVALGIALEGLEREAEFRELPAQIIERMAQALEGKAE